MGTTKLSCIINFSSYQTETNPTINMRCFIILAFVAYASAATCYNRGVRTTYVAPSVQKSSSSSSSSSYGSDCGYGYGYQPCGYGYGGYGGYGYGGRSYYGGCGGYGYGYQPCYGCNYGCGGYYSDSDYSTTYHVCEPEVYEYEYEEEECDEPTTLITIGHSKNSDSSSSSSSDSNQEVFISEDDGYDSYYGYGYDDCIVPSNVYYA